MSAYRAVLVTLLVAGSLAVVAGASAAATAPADSVATAQNETDTANASLGGDISSFMQSSAAEITGAVETGMWSARYNSTPNDSERRRLVERRTDALSEELADLRERKRELMAEREAGNISEAAYRAQVGQLVGRINALESAINATEPKARQVNASVDAVERLQAGTAELSGPEIAAVARNSSGVDTPAAGVGNGNGNGDGGPPEQAGNGSGDAGPSATAVNASNGNGPGAPGNGNGGAPGDLDDAPGDGAANPKGGPSDGAGPSADRSNRTDGNGPAAAAGGADSNRPASTPAGA